MTIHQGNKVNQFSGVALTGYMMSVALVVLILKAVFPLYSESEIELPGNGPWCIPLILEDETEIGVVKVAQAGDTITALYTISEVGWCLNDTQAHVGLSNMPELYDDFLYQHDDLGCVTSDVFNVIGTVGDDLNVGFHAGVHQDAQIIMDALTTYRGRVTESIAHPGDDSYFDTTVSGDITGTFGSFSIDTARSISTGRRYDSNVISSYDPNFPEELIYYPENLDLINYIINQDYTGHGYTYGDVQRAIWTIIAERVSITGLRDWSQSRVDRIVEKAETNGEEFMPDCDGGVVAMVLQPVRPNGETHAQVIIIEVPMAAIGACTAAQTPENGAWAIPGESPITQIVDLTCE